MPSSLRETTFFLDDREELAPEGEAGNGRHVSQVRDVKREDVGFVKDEKRKNNCISNANGKCEVVSRKF